MTRENIQNKVYKSQAFSSYKTASEQQKEDYYFSYDLNCNNNEEKIDPDSLFCHSAKALNIKQASDGLTDLKYDLHILLVGTTLQPLMLSVSAINAAKIFLLYDDSKEGEDKKDYLCDYIKAYKSIKAESEAINSSKPHTVFSAIKKITEKDEWSGKEICIDVTGGKKSMVSGGFLASSVLGIDTYYIDFEKYERGNPILCTEFLNKLDNPYDIYNIELLNQARELFRHHNYQASVSLFEKIKEKLDSIENLEEYNLVNEKTVIESMLNAAKCYMYWDSFDYFNAEKFSLNIHEDHVEHLKQLKIFSELNQKSERYKSDSLYNFAIDRYLNAQRKSHHNVIKDDSLQYHDAIFRYAQCVEILIEALITKKVSEYNPDEKTKSIFSVTERQDLIFKGKAQSNKDEKGNRISFKMTKLEDPNYELRHKTKNLSKRRDEFAHVSLDAQNSNIQEAEYVAKTFIKILFEKSDDEIENDLKKFAFPTEFNDDGTLKFHHAQP